MNGESIVIPEKSKIDVVYAVIDSGIQLIPYLGGSISTLLKECINTPYDSKTRKWQGEISHLVANLITRLDEIDPLREQRLSCESSKLIMALVCDCPNGLASTRYSMESLSKLLTDTDNETIRDSAHELASYDLCKIDEFVNGWALRLTNCVYSYFDRVVMPWDNRQDTIALSRHILSSSEGNSRELIGMLGWTTRRFNPAMYELVSHLPQNLIRNIDQSEFIVYGILITDETRSAMKKIISAYEGIAI